MIRIPADVVHRVTDDDSLYGLSWRYYGTSAGAAWIWLRNYDLIGDDPDVLPVGADVVIPALETVDKQARFTATVSSNEALPHIRDPRIRRAAVLYGLSWPVQMHKVLAANGGADNRPSPGSAGVMPARGKGYPIDTAERWRRETG